MPDLPSAVQRLAGRAGIPVCIVRERPPDAIELACIVTDPLLWTVPGLGTSVNVRGYAVSPGSCVLELDVEDQGEDRHMARAFAATLERFVVSSAAVGVAVEVGPWIDRRPPRVVQIGR